MITQDEKASELELYYGQIFVGRIAKPFCSDETWYGKFTTSTNHEPNNLLRRLHEFIQFSERWNERVERGDAPDADEFEPYSDLLTSGLWSTKSEDEKPVQISEAPVFSPDSDVSWRYA